MIRFRIFGIFHKHFVWRLLNYNWEGKKKHSKTIKSDLFTSTFLYNTHTQIYILYIYIYNCTYKVCVNKSLYNLNIIWKRYLHTFYICTKIGIFFLLGGNNCEMIKSIGIRYIQRRTSGWYFYRNGVLRYIFIMCSLFCSGTKDQFGLLQQAYFLKNASKWRHYDNQISSHIH